jgi:putative SOS response-associated peptidase YedK
MKEIARPEDDQRLAETLLSKGAYKRAFRKRRCIIPADGFYEWTTVPGQKKKQPMYIHRTDDEPLAFAGLWEVWRNKDDPDEQLRSCTIITGAPNEKIAEIHDRMPVILPAGDRWSTRSSTTSTCSASCSCRRRRADRASGRLDVNNVRNNGAPRRPVDPAAAGGRHGHAAPRRDGP